MNLYSYEIINVRNEETGEVLPALIMPEELNENLEHADVKYVNGEILVRTPSHTIRYRHFPSVKALRRKILFTGNKIQGFKEFLI